MAYRGDRSVLERELEELERTLSSLHASALDAVTAVGRRVALETEIARVQSSLRGERVAPPLLHRLKVVTACDQPWTSMSGTEAVRRCLVCDKDVYSLEAMTVPEIEAMVRDAKGEPCVRLLRRRDGTIVTRECLGAEVDRRLERRRRTKVTAMMIAALVAGSAFLYWRSLHTPVRTTGVAAGSTSIGVL